MPSKESLAARAGKSNGKKIGHPGTAGHPMPTRGMGNGDAPEGKAPGRRASADNEHAAAATMALPSPSGSRDENLTDQPSVTEILGVTSRRGAGANGGRNGDDAQLDKT